MVHLTIQPSKVIGFFSAQDRLNWADMVSALGLPLRASVVTELNCRVWQQPRNDAENIVKYMKIRYFNMMLKSIMIMVLTFNREIYIYIYDSESSCGK